MSYQKNLKHLTLSIDVSSEAAYEEIEKRLIQNVGMGEDSDHLEIELRLNEVIGDIEKLPLQTLRILRAMQLLNQERWILKISILIPFAGTPFAVSNTWVVKAAMNLMSVTLKVLLTLFCLNRNTFQCNILPMVNLKNC